ERMGGDRIPDEAVKPERAGLVLREPPETLEEVPVTMGRRDGGVAALRDRAQVRSLQSEVPDDGPRFVQGDDRHELPRLVQMDDPVRIVEIGVAVAVAERAIDALRDADRVLRTKAANRIGLRGSLRLVGRKRRQLAVGQELRDVAVPAMRREMELHARA